MKKIIIIVLFAILISGCTVQGETTYKWQDDPVADSVMAELALTNFLSLLNQHQYQQASQYYGGDYDFLYKMNPDVKREQKAILLQKYCLENDGACLIPDIIGLNQEDQDFIFTVVFYDKEGNLFKTPGCSCKGGGKSEFKFRVEKNNPQFLVKDLPPLDIET